jgi:phosphate transport system substrate-binding protein
VASDKDGVGFVGLSFVKDVKALALQDGDASPVEATALTVSTESYVLSRRLFLYVPESAKAEAWSFVQFVTSDAGQDVVAREGFVPLNSAPVESQVPANAPDEYKRILTGAKRLPFDLRFRTGTADLDAKARSDLARAARHAASQGSGRELVAIGFADRSGPEPKNVDLSRARAKTVAEVLRQIDAQTHVQTAGFGSALPVAPNDTEHGRERNRRVEVWLR